MQGLANERLWNRTCSDNKKGSITHRRDQRSIRYTSERRCIDDHKSVFCRKFIQKLSESYILQKWRGIFQKLCTRNNTCIFNICLIYNLIIFRKTGKIMIQSLFVRNIHLNTFHQDGITQIHINKYTRESCLCKHFPQIYSYRTLSLVRETARQHDLLGIFATEFNVYSKTVHRFFHCVRKIRKYQFQFIHFSFSFFSYCCVLFPSVPPGHSPESQSTEQVRNISPYLPLYEWYHPSDI